MSRIVVGELPRTNFRSAGVQQRRSDVLDLVDRPVKVVRVLRYMQDANDSIGERYTTVRDGANDDHGPSLGEASS